VFCTTSLSTLNFVQGKTIFFYSVKIEKISCLKSSKESDRINPSNDDMSLQKEELSQKCYHKREKKKKREEKINRKMQEIMKRMVYLQRKTLTVFHKT